MNRRLLAGIAALNLLILIVGWFALISPQRSDAAASAAKTQEAQTELAALSGGGTPSGPTKQPAIHTADIYALDTALPSQVDEPDLLFELDRIATGTGVKILGLSPQLGQAMPTGYTVAPISLSLAGTYYNLTRFLRTLRMLVSERNGKLIANGPLFSVNSIGLTPGASADATGKADVATVSIAAYYYGAVDGATPPASTTTDTTTTTGG